MASTKVADEVTAKNASDKETENILSDINWMKGKNAVADEEIHEAL